MILTIDLKRQYFQVNYERIPNVVLTVISEFSIHSVFLSQGSLRFCLRDGATLGRHLSVISSLV